MNPILLLGALFGFSGLGFAAFASHGLASDSASAVATAAQTQQIQALLLVALGLSRYLHLPGRLATILKLSALIVIIGVLMFATPIYLEHIWGFDALSFIVPIGGMTIMAAWLVVALGALVTAKRF